MPDRQQTYAKILELIEPFNKKGVDDHRGDALRPGPRVG